MIKSRGGRLNGDLEFSRPVRLLAFLIFIALNACNGQPPCNPKPTSNNILPGVQNSDQETDGIIYFSYNNGLSWENKSTGLSATTSIGLGGITVSGNKLALISKDSGLYFFKTQDDKWVHIPTNNQLLESNVGALLFYKDCIYAGTQTGGVFYSKNDGKTWTTLNVGLDDLTIRKLAEIENVLYAATNSGLYSFNELLNLWELEYGNCSLQVNGITDLGGTIYIATSQGAFASPIGKKDWKSIFSEGSLHNISSDGNTLYAMVYNELFSSANKGLTWQNIQNGLPAELYTFNVIKTNNVLLAGQWDGVYKKEKHSEHWELSSNGLPEKLAISNMLVYDEIIVVSGNERKLRKGMTTDK
jgi:photosystem II stability/assembly factor-like uncharacterized protein